MRHQLSLLHVCLLMLTAVSAVAQQPNAFDLIPDTASFVVRLQTPDQTVKDVANFVDQVQPGFGPVVEGQAAALGQAIQNPTLAGVDRTKDWYLLAFPSPSPNPSDSPPEAVYLIPVTDADAARAALGDRFGFAEKNGYLAWSEEAILAEQMKSCFDGKTAAISKKMDEASAKKMMASHLTVFINAEALKATYADELARADEQLEEVLAAMADQIKVANPGLDPEMALGIYRTMGAYLIQAARDSESAVASINITDGILRIEELLTVAKGSQADQFLASHPVSDMARLTKIPAGLDGYFGVSGDPTRLIAWAGEFLDSQVTDEAAKQKFVKALKAMEGVKIGAYVGGGGLDLDRDDALQLFGTVEANPADQLRAATMMFQDEMKYEIGGITQTQSFKMNVDTIDGQAVDLYQFNQTVPPALDPTGIQSAINKRFYGANGLQQRLVFKKDLVMTTAGGGTEAMKQLLNASEWTDSNLLKARAALHKESNLILLTDVPNMVLDFAKLILETGTIPVPVQAEQLEPLKIAPSYAGFSMAVAPQQLHFRTNVPVETFQGFAQIGMFVQGLMMAN